MSTSAATTHQVGTAKQQPATTGWRQRIGEYLRQGLALQAEVVPEPLADRRKVHTGLQNRNGRTVFHGPLGPILIA